MSGFTEQNLEDLSDELKQFTEGMRKFTGKFFKNGEDPGTGPANPTTPSSNPSNAAAQKISAEFDKSTQKIVNALAQLSVNLTKSSASDREKAAELRSFSNSVNKVTNAQEKYTDLLIRKENKVQKDARDAVAAQKVIDDANAAAAEAARRSTLLFNGRVEDIVNSLKDFGASIKSIPSDVKESFTRLKDFNNSLKDETKTLQQRISVYRSHDNVGKQTFESLSRVGSSSEIFTTKLDVMSNGSKLVYTSTQALAAAFEGFSKSVTGYSSALYRGERGAKVTAKAVTDLATPMLDLAGSVGNVVTALSLFMPGGIFVKGALAIGGLLLKGVETGGKAFLKYTELAAEQSDTLYTSFMDINKSGVVLSGGLTDTFATMQEFGMSVSEASQFTSMLAGSAKDLKFLGATAGEGAKQFSKVAGSLYKSDLGRELELMGVSQEEQREAALKYMSIQAKTGQIQTRNVELLVKSSAEFVKEMDLAAQYTGNTRKEQIEQREAAYADERFNAAMREAEATNDVRKINVLKKAQAIAANLANAGDEVGRVGVLQLAASGGALTTDAAQQAESQYGVSRSLFNNALTEKDIPDIMKGAARYSRMQDRSLAGTNMLIGKTTLQTPGQGSSNIQDRETAVAEAVKVAMKEANFFGTSREFFETEQGKRAKTEIDKKLAEQTDIRRSQKNVALMQDNFINTFISTGDKLKFAAETFEKAVKEFGGKVNGGPIQTGAGGATVVSSNTRPNGVPISHVITPTIKNNLSDIKAAMIKRGEKDENFLTAALGNVMKESGGINQAENLERYANTDNERIKEVFGERASSLPVAELNRVKADPKLFSEAMYGGEFGKKNLGNMEPGDAWKYRGRGYIQLTGKAMYAKASQAIYKDDRLVTNPDLITQDHRVAAEVTAWFFEQGKPGLASKMQIPLSGSTPREAALLTASIVAGGDVRQKRKYIKNDLVNQVQMYASKGGTEGVKDIVATPPQTTLKAEQPAWKQQPVKTDSGKTGFEKEQPKPPVKTETNPTSPKTEAPDWLPRQPVKTESEKTSSMVKSTEEALALLNFDNKGSGQREDFLALNSDVQNKVLVAAKEYNELTGLKLKVNSARRTFEEQDLLRKNWESGKSKIYAAPAGTSNHEKGRALDIQQGMDGDVAAITALNRQGLSQTVPNDPVHFQAKEGGVFKGPSTGYDVTMHKNEAVVPLDENGVSKQPLNTAMFPEDNTDMKTLIALMERTNDKYDQIIDLLTTSADNSNKLVAATA